MKHIRGLWKRNPWLAGVICVAALFGVVLSVREHFWGKAELKENLAEVTRDRDSKAAQLAPFLALALQKFGDAPQEQRLQLLTLKLGQTGTVSTETDYLEVPALITFRITYRYPQDVEPSERDKMSKAWGEIFMGRSVPFPPSIPRSDSGEGSLIAVLEQKNLPAPTVSVVARGYYTDSVINPSGGPPARVTWGVNFRSMEYQRSALTNGADIELKFTVEGSGLQKDFDGTIRLNQNDWLSASNNIKLRWKGDAYVADALILDRQPLHSRFLRSH